VPDRPYVLLSAAVSVDGYIDDATPDRLLLSDAADLDRVDEVRAGVDAILVGAGTIRADNPRLLVRSAARRAARAGRGQPPSPARVTLTSRGGLADELQLMVAPFFVGGGVRLTGAGAYPHGPGRPMRLAQAAALGDAVLLRYLLQAPA
jgi:5-amino-6-(5-phosphoribosylamino)uracil reductase